MVKSSDSTFPFILAAYGKVNRRMERANSFQIASFPFSSVTDQKSQFKLCPYNLRGWQTMVVPVVTFTARWLWAACSISLLRSHNCLSLPPVKEFHGSRGDLKPVTPVAFYNDPFNVQKVSFLAVACPHGPCQAPNHSQPPPQTHCTEPTLPYCYCTFTQENTYNEISASLITPEVLRSFT